MLGLKNYELSNHLGNILNVVTDRKLPVVDQTDPTKVAYFTGDVVSYSDYLPFGMTMPGRSGNSDAYNYGFNGMRKDNEIKGEGNSYDFGARIYDPRIGRWLSRDPLEGKYPGMSPYNFVSNNPIILNDPTGKSGEVTINKETKEITITAHMIFYGSKSTTELATQTAKDVQDKWNEAQGTVMIEGVSYSVKFVVTGEHKPDLTPAEMAANTDIKNNYIRVEDANSSGVSNMTAGGNSGYFLTKNIQGVGSTTEAHEMGHGWGLDGTEYGTTDGHPSDHDLIGEGQPGIMHARGTLVDPQFQYDPNATPGTRGGTVNPEKRKVTQQNINELDLNELSFDASGKAKLGSLTNNYRNNETPPSTTTTAPAR
jgi:RHS repeat-associated protein